MAPWLTFVPGWRPLATTTTYVTALVFIILFATDVVVNVQGETRVRGEFTIVLGPLPAATSPSATDEVGTIRALLFKLKADGVARSEAVRLTVDALQLPKSVVYKVALQVEDW